MKHFLLSLFALSCAGLACGPFFYPAPPTLEHFPERLPVKTMRELLQETQTPPKDAPTFDQLVEETQAIARDLGVKPAAEIDKAIERELVRNRVGEYRKRIANCLYDFRDLLGSTGVPDAEIRAYAAWRVDAMQWDNGLSANEPTEEIYIPDAKPLAVRHTEWLEELDKTATFLRDEAAKSAPVLKPHWLVQAGAWQFKHGRFAEAAQLFQKVITEVPKHPRAEVAQLMLARARIEEWSVANRKSKLPGAKSGEDIGAKYDAAKEALDAYVAAYPHGRFAPDIPGWRGGLARENGDLKTAISSFLSQMDFADHPEIVRRAVRECEVCLDLLDASDFRDQTLDEGAYNEEISVLPLSEIARRPVAALALVYHFLDSESRRGFDDLLNRGDMPEGRNAEDPLFPPVLRMRRVGREILPVLAEAVAKRKENYGGKVWRPKYLAILAWAASECGDHAQAVRICDLAGPAIDHCDDLLFARGVALQRAGELDKAITAFRRVQEKYPESPLSNEIRFRIFTALRDKHESGLALVEIARLELEGTEAQATRWNVPFDANNAEEAPLIHEEAETAQWVDTLLQFAPLAELERAFTVPNLEPAIAAKLRPVLRMRYLASEDFGAALRFAEPEPKEVPADRMNNHPLELTGDEWRKAVENLSQLKREIDSSKTPPVRAQKLFAMGKAWASLRGRLTLPSVEDDRVFADEFYKSWALREQNARIAGLARPTTVQELEQRDELRHAYRYYLLAADLASDKALLASVLSRASNALRRMAELSPWSAARAFENNDSATSRRLHERLLRECPASDEAKVLSAWWSFAPAGELRWLPGDRQSYNVEVAIADAFEGSTRPVDDSSQWKDYDEFGKRLDAVAAKAGTESAAKLLEELEAIRRDFLPGYTSQRGSWVINDIDDLILFLHEPGLTPSAQAKYFAARLGDHAPYFEDPELKPWRDYVAFLSRVRETRGEDPNTGQTLRRPMSERMREFLDQFPHSGKREAALARLAIALVRETHGHCGVETTEWPAAPKLGGYKELAIHPLQPFDRARVFAGLDAYEKEFPHGRYSAEMRLWRGIASIDAEDWKTAVDMLVATLDDGTKRDLHLDAALNLAYVFMQLLDEPKTRPGIIAALRENPSAQKRLTQFARSETLGARLACFDGYLEEQFGRPSVGE